MNSGDRDRLVPAPLPKGLQALRRQGAELLNNAALRMRA
jgi:hypothetical protein